MYPGHGNSLRVTRQAHSDPLVTPYMDLLLTQQHTGAGHCRISIPIYDKLNEPCVRNARVARFIPPGFAGRALIRAYKVFCHRHTHAFGCSHGQMFLATYSHMPATIRLLEAHATREAKAIRNHQRQEGELMANPGAQF